MKLIRREFLRLAWSAVAASGFSSAALAQAYPTRPITMVIPYAAGGGIDAIGRVLAEAMRRPIGQPVIIENVAGASGTIGVARVARAAPDGHTFILGNCATHVLNVPLLALQYDRTELFRAPFARFKRASDHRGEEIPSGKRSEGFCGSG